MARGQQPGSQEEVPFMKTMNSHSADGNIEALPSEQANTPKNL